MHSTQCPPALCRIALFADEPVARRLGTTERARPLPRTQPARSPTSRPPPTLTPWGGSALLAAPSPAEVADGPEGVQAEDPPHWLTASDLGSWSMMDVSLRRGDKCQAGRDEEKRPHPGCGRQLCEAFLRARHVWSHTRLPGSRLSPPASRPVARSRLHANSLLSAIVPTAIAQRWFSPPAPAEEPHHLMPPDPSEILIGGQ
jgi:hypothetical protein